MSSEVADGKGLAEEVAELEWYHTLELAPGVVTPGWLDTRQIVDEVGFPASLDGLRCLDVATFNGFWAFEMERRGADEVVGIDVLDPHAWDWPIGSEEHVVAAVGARQAQGRGFEIAKRELGSVVERRELSVYDLDPDEVGEFDLVYVGSLLVHLRDPVRALERIRSVCRGRLIVVDGVDPLLSAVFRRLPVATLDGVGRPWWWYPNVAGLARAIRVAGFRIGSRPRRIHIPSGAARPTVGFRPSLLRSHAGRMELTVSLRGDPHAVVHAEPAKLG